LFVACSSKEDGPSDGNGRLVVKLTDAPFPANLVDKALVYIDKIEIRSYDATESEEAATFTTIYEGDAKEFDLLDLNNGVTADLLTYDLPAGEYDLIRMHVSDATIILKDSREFNLKVPSGQQSGLKIKLDPTLQVVAGEEVNVLLDFDVSKSFVVKGNINKVEHINGFIFKPVVRAPINRNVGIIEGKVTVAGTAGTVVPQAEVRVMAADTTLTTTFTDETGYYKLLGFLEEPMFLNAKKMDIVQYLFQELR
jgi:hypothetical protein